MKVKIESGEVRKTCCPDLQCGIDICEEDIEKILPGDLFGKFQRFLFFDRLRENENARWCPKPDCDFAIVVDDTIRYSSSFPKLTCTHCETEFCFDCSAIVHSFLVFFFSFNFYLFFVGSVARRITMQSSER